MKTLVAKTVFVALLAALPALSASATSPSGGTPALARQMDPARGGASLRVTSAEFNSGGTMDERFTQNGENHSPPIDWSRGPEGTRSFAVLMEDSSVDRPEPITHWVIYEIPSTMRELHENRPTEAKLEDGSMQGQNIANKTGYIGPKPPAGQTHAYHIQVFALNTHLSLDPAQATRDDVVKAMKGHVLAVGDLVVNYTGH